MNEYNINVDFIKGRISTNLRRLVQNDYNSTKLNFTFDKEGRVLFKMKYPDGTQYVDEIQNNELIFRKGILNQEGTYEYEISLYSEDGRLTDYATKSFEVRSELVDTDEVVTPDDRVPILDTLINEVDAIKQDVAAGKYNGEKGPKGDAGSVKFIVVNELPSENIEEDAIYMKPKENPDSPTNEKNMYQEYIYVNGTWESLGGASVEVDLTGYATEEYVDNTSAQVASVKLEPYYWDGQGSSSSNQTNVVLFQSIINNMKEGKKVCVITTNTNDSRTKNLENVILFPATGIDVSTYTGKLYFTSQGYNHLSVNTTGYCEVNLMMRRYSTYINMTEGVVTYVHKIDAYNNQVTADSGILTKNNKMQFIPTHDYNPVNKKYVDDAIATLKAELQGGE